MPPPSHDLTLRQAAAARARELAEIYDDLVPLDRLREACQGTTRADDPPYRTLTVIRIPSWSEQPSRYVPGTVSLRL